MATIKVTYKAPKVVDLPKVAPIAPEWDRADVSYVDTEVFKEHYSAVEGYNAALDRVPAFNHEDDFGYLDAKAGIKIGLPYPNNMGMLDLEQVGKKEVNGTITYSFDCDDKDVAFFKRAAELYAEYGYTIEVTETAKAAEPTESTT